MHKNPKIMIAITLGVAKGRGPWSGRGGEQASNVFMFLFLKLDDCYTDTLYIYTFF